MNCQVTVKKDFELYGAKYYAGTYITLIPGSNIPNDIFNQLIETGAIELGLNEEFMKAKGAENGRKNLADRESSN